MESVTTAMGECLTISFRNMAHNPPSYQVIVCRDQQVFNRQKTRLGTLDHIEILHAGLSRLATE